MRSRRPSALMVSSMIWLRPCRLKAGSELTSSRMMARPSRQESESMSVSPVRCWASSKMSSGTVTQSSSLTLIAFRGDSWLDGEVAAVDGDAGTGYVGGGVGAKKQHRPCTVLGSSRTPERSVEADFDVH